MNHESSGLSVRYATQRSAQGFFVTMLVLFLVQVAFGLLLALIHLDPSLLRGVLNFNVARALHLNLAVIWIVTGFAGLMLFVGPLLGEREVRPAWLPRVLLGAIWLITLWTAGTLLLAQWGIAGWRWGEPWLQQGLEYLEAGRLSDLLLLVGFGTMAYLAVSLFPRRLREWTEMHWGLAGGFAGLTVMWVFGLFFVPTLDLQEYFRWYVVHYWVEGIWEVIHISFVGFLLWKLFDADARAVGFAVFWGVLLVLLTGLLGNAHHYFWIGTPAFWQFWGSLFSALEPLPMLFCIWHVYLDARHGRKPLENRPAFYFIFGSALLEQVGAGILGFTQTFALTNVWEHGTWVTPAHGHMALFGTFGLLVIGGAYAALPAIWGLKHVPERLAKLSFWLLLVGITGIAVSFAWGGTVEVYVYRVLGLDWFGEQVRPAMALPRALLGLFGLLFTTGAVTLAYDLLTLKGRVLARETPQREDEGPAQLQPTFLRRPLSLGEMGTWLAGLWFFGFLITLGLFAFNLRSVRLGDPTVPYLLAAVGYIGLFALTLGFAARFLSAFEAEQARLRGLLSRPEPEVIVQHGQRRVAQEG